MNKTWTHNEVEFKVVKEDSYKLVATDRRSRPLMSGIGIDCVRSWDMVNNKKFSSPNVGDRYRFHVFQNTIIQRLTDVFLCPRVRQMSILMTLFCPI